MSRLWFEMSFLKAVIIIIIIILTIICQFFNFICCCCCLLFLFEEAGLRSPPFLTSLEREASDQDVPSALTK